MNTKVSICCLTYNQKQYIKQTIDSFISQKTDFKYEIVIHDDCSTDGTIDILNEYESKYPDLIKVIYEKENLYSQGKKIEQIAYKNCSGKYIALCEGDDYWCDNTKLQKQFEFMKLHPNCSLVTHGCYLLDSKTDKLKKKSQPFKGSRYYSIEEIISGDGGIFATNSMFFEKKSVMNMPDFYYNISIGDFPTMLHLALCGDIYYIDEFMSVYRVGAAGSWSIAQTTGNKEQIINKQTKFYTELENMLAEINKITEGKYNKAISELLLKKKYMLLLLIEDYEQIKKEEFKQLYKIYSLKEFKQKIKLFLVRNMPNLYRKMKG